MTYRFFGSFAEVGHVRLERLGQSISATEHEADEFLALEPNGGGSPLCILPDEDFKQIFSADDIKRYAYHGARVGAPQEFKDKLKAAGLRFDDWRNERRAIKHPPMPEVPPAE
jgi:hypothetical protein